jgi:ribose transport system permease protein
MNAHIFKPDLWKSPHARALLALATVVAVGCIFNQDGAFFRWTTHRDMLRDIAVPGILASGMTLVILSGGIDLAVSSVLALSAVAFSLLTMPLGWAAITAIVAVLALGTLAGATSGVFVARFRLQPFIVTLAMMVFVRGLAKRLSGGRKITAYLGGSGALPRIFDALDARVLGGEVAIVTVIFVACVLATWFVLAYTRFGRWLYAVGGNAEASRFSGVPVERVLVYAYAFSGLFAAIAGICQAAQETHGDPDTAMGYELDAIAMVVIGGTSLSGGRGGVGLTLLGVLTIGYLRKILSINAFATDTRLMLTGPIILAAALFQKGR